MIEEKKKLEQYENEAFGRLFEAISKAIGQFENESKSLITKQMVERRAKAGYCTNRPKLGYITTDVKGIHAPNTNTANALRGYIQDTIAGKMTINQLRIKISHIYHDTKLISWARFKAIVLDPYYAGFVVVNGQKYKGLHEPLISQDEHNKLKELLG